MEHTNEASNVRRVIGIVSGKGGVGKALVTSLLAAACDSGMIESADTGWLEGMITAIGQNA